MKYNPEIHHHKTIRLQNYDYSQEGLYFITICVNGRLNLFGNIEMGNEKYKYSKIIDIKNDDEIFDDTNNVVIGQPQGIAPTNFELLKNTDNVGIPLVGIQKITNMNKTIGDIIGAFKSITTNKYIRGVKNQNWGPFNKRLWQANYWEHIIRKKKEYLEIAEYIVNNPLKWEFDKLYEK